MATEDNDYTKKPSGKSLVVKVAPKRGRAPVSSVRRRKANKLMNKALPSFRQRKCTPKSTPPSVDDDQYYTADEQLPVDELPSDTFLAIQSIQQQQQGLHIPYMQNGGNHLQGVTEWQIYNRFESTHASSVLQELQKLQLRILQPPMAGTGTASQIFITNIDYISGIWDAHHFHRKHEATVAQDCEVFVKCFIECLDGCLRNKSRSFSKILLEDGCPQHSTTNKTQSQFINEMLDYLVKIRVLLTVTRREVEYQWWLPNWGVVLREWDGARTSLLNYISRSKRKEASMMNVVRENRHPCLSTQFLVDDLLHYGKLQRVERPIGVFLKRL